MSPAAGAGQGAANAADAGQSQVTWLPHAVIARLASIRGHGRQKDCENSSLEMKLFSWCHPPSGPFL